MALKRLKEAGTKLICLSPNINFLTDLVHFCYPSPQLEKKLHHFSSSAFTSPFLQGATCILKRAECQHFPKLWTRVMGSPIQSSSFRFSWDKGLFSQNMNYGTLGIREGGRDGPSQFERFELSYRSPYPKSSSRQPVPDRDEAEMTRQVSRIHFDTAAPNEFISIVLCCISSLETDQNSLCVFSTFYIVFYIL